jgi:hypothetical protein
VSVTLRQPAPPRDNCGAFSRLACRVLGAITAGGTLAVVATGCASADPLDEYLAAVRAVPSEAAHAPDGQLIISGKMMCEFSKAAPLSPEAEQDAFWQAVKPHCATLTAPFTPEQVQRYEITPGPLGSGATAPPVASGTGSTTPAPVELGKRFDVLDDSGTIMAQVAITDIEVDPNCSEARRYTSTTPTPKNGHFIAIRLDVQTMHTYNKQAFSYPTGYDFTVTGPDGYTEGGVYADDMCIADHDQFDGPMQPSSKYRGWVLIDSPAAQGSITFRPHFALTWPGVTVAIPTSGKASVPAEAPRNTDTAPGVGETDYATMRDRIRANGGEPTSRAESQYLFACQQGTLPADVCP